MRLLTRFHGLLRRPDQAAAAGVLALGVAIVMGWLAMQGDMGRRLVEADRPVLKTAQFQADINTAEGPELLQLPGVGEQMVQRVMKSRREKGCFETIEDLRRVRGIGPKTLEKLRPYLCDPANAGKS
jgi:competence protein ComEA